MATCVEAPHEIRSLAPLARTPVFVVAGLFGVVLLAVAGRYGYFGDELYFLAAGRHLAWGYADQPPLVPVLARILESLAPGNVFVLRLPAMAVMVVAVVVSALIARELGGGRRAQVMAAATFAVSTQFVASGHYLATSTFDPFFWTLLGWLLVRWVRTRADDLLVWAGVVTGLALNTKFLVGAFWGVAVLAVLACGPRELLRRPALWLGGLIALAMVAPTLGWQATHGWPQLAMSAAISQEVAAMPGGRAMIVPVMLFLAGLPVAALLLGYGGWRLMRSPALREYRFLGWTTAGLTVLFVVIAGRQYYVAGLYGVCWAAAAVEFERGQPARWWRWAASWPVYVLTALVMLPTALPVWPQSWLRDHPGLPKAVFSAEEIGWPEVAGSIAKTFHALPDPAHTAIVTRMYWQAAAVDHYGPAFGLPEPASPNRGYHSLVTPPDSAVNVLYAGPGPQPLQGHFADVKRVGTVDSGLGIPNTSQGLPLWLATGRAESWATLWPKLRDFHV
ncbi:phospholipid carrier-dependent glycosyltransferase [Amycolatopsis balhimycina DSM 5908]|uniref:Phospholipid carrier-dependent glycosyltransferase n=1 Tax=Amycolatopsis balhimycina DSM 5908 TaxID=1081091 RepID=A0A428W193_AMYBA|nr:phospholipid carrier-dependent glycosyltransferase [Amycolatopsis balhimycina DSM 5908]